MWSVPDTKLFGFLGHPSLLEIVIVSANFLLSLESWSPAITLKVQTRLKLSSSFLAAQTSISTSASLVKSKNLISTPFIPL